jgi:predicted signal transduction protein with EAL and GGDEF domain
MESLSSAQLRVLGLVSLTLIAGAGHRCIGQQPAPDLSEASLEQLGDIQVHSAKQKGPNNIEFFTNDLNFQMVERLKLESGLRLALDGQEFYLLYQPQIDIATNTIVGVEVLIRWHHPELGLIPPDRFIGIAENSGLIVRIGEWS